MESRQKRDTLNMNIAPTHASKALVLLSSLIRILLPTQRGHYIQTVAELNKRGFLTHYLSATMV